MPADLAEEVPEFLATQEDYRSGDELVEAEETEEGKFLNEELEIKPHHAVYPLGPRLTEQSWPPVITFVQYELGGSGTRWRRRMKTIWQSARHNAEAWRRSTMQRPWNFCSWMR